MKMPSQIVEPQPGNDVVDDAKFMMLVLLVLTAVMSAYISCVVCAFLRHRRRQDREDSILRQFHNAEYDHVDSLDCTRSSSQSRACTWEMSSLTGTPCLPPGQSKVPEVLRHCDEKIVAPERSNSHVTNEYTSCSVDEGFYLKYPHRYVKHDLKPHEVDLDMPHLPPMRGHAPYTSAKQPSIYSAALDVQSDHCPPKCLQDIKQTHTRTQYVNQTSLQTDDRKIETQSSDLYSKLHDPNRRLIDNYSDVRLFGEQSDLRLSLGKTVPFPDRTNVHIYNDEEELSHFDVFTPYDGLNQDLRTPGSSDINKPLARHVSSTNGNVATEDISIEDDGDASSTSDDLYVNSDPWFTRASKTVTTERARFGDSSDTSSEGGAVMEREECKISSISNEMYTNSDSWENSVYVNQPMNFVASGSHRYVSSDMDEALFGSTITMAESKTDEDEADTSYMQDDIYLNWESRNESDQMNKTTMQGYYKRPSSDTSHHQFINHDTGLVNMSDTSSSSENVNFYSDISTLATMKGESIELAQGVDRRQTDTDVRCSETEEDDNSFESDNIYINSDVLSVVEHEKGKRIIGATSSQSKLIGPDNDEGIRYTAWSMSSDGANKGIDRKDKSDENALSCFEDVNFYSDSSTLATMRGESTELSQGVDRRRIASDIRCSEIEEDDDSFESDNIYINYDVLSVIEHEKGKCIIGAASSQSMLICPDNDKGIRYTASSDGTNKGIDRMDKSDENAQNCSEGVNNDCDLTSDTQVEAENDDSYYFQIY